MNNITQFYQTQSKTLSLEKLNQKYNGLDPKLTITWALETFGDNLVMSTSFGIHSAVMLHLATQICPDIPVIWIDTGYLYPETYNFAERLTKRLKLNLKVYQSSVSPARMEAKYGNLWERKEIEALNFYDRIRKVEPMQRALRELKAKGWIAGLRSQQTTHRSNLKKIERHSEYYKILPILDWTAVDIDNYLKANNLPYHPLFEQGYITLGDWHSSRPVDTGDSNARDTRFQGLKQECGLHIMPLQLAN